MKYTVFTSVFNFIKKDSTEVGKCTYVVTPLCLAAFGTRLPTSTVISNSTCTKWDLKLVPLPKPVQNVLFLLPVVLPVNTC